ncbi:hypothetical protein I4U23_027159 [Adineta vaga]|nr:hypothetical protein I4U23_027159 [Adineta vaga]
MSTLTSRIAKFCSGSRATHTTDSTTCALDGQFNGVTYDSTVDAVNNARFTGNTYCNSVPLNYGLNTANGGIGCGSSTVTCPSGYCCVFDTTGPGVNSNSGIILLLGTATSTNNNIPRYVCVSSCP